jgi:hypothetical protein
MSTHDFIGGALFGTIILIIGFVSGYWIAGDKR